MEKLLNDFRRRLSEYRSKRIDTEVSIHINAMEIALNLSEYAHFNNRKVQKEEQKWFDAGLQLEYVFGGSEWEDLLEYYNDLQLALKKRCLFEN
mgnify:CR=1 FL=1